jgi:hypothetical protein
MAEALLIGAHRLWNDPTEKPEAKQTSLHLKEKTARSGLTVSPEV